MQHIITKVGKHKIDRAKQLYLGGIAPSDISEMLDMDLNDLGYMVFGMDATGNDASCWYAIKKSRPSGSIYTYSKIKPVLLKQTEMKLAEMIDNSAQKMLESQSESDDPLSLDDMSKAAGIMEKFDKITRLEEGSATEIIDTGAGYSLRDIINGEIIDSDVDSSDIEEVPFNPLADNTPTSDTISDTAPASVDDE